MIPRGKLPDERLTLPFPQRSTLKPGPPAECAAPWAPAGAGTPVHLRCADVAHSLARERREMNILTTGSVRSCAVVSAWAGGPGGTVCGMGRLLPSLGDRGVAGACGRNAACPVSFLGRAGPAEGHPGVGSSGPVWKSTSVGRPSRTSVSARSPALSGSEAMSLHRSHC